MTSSPDSTTTLVDETKVTVTLGPHGRTVDLEPRPQASQEASDLGRYLLEVLIISERLPTHARFERDLHEHFPLWQLAVVDGVPALLRDDKRVFLPAALADFVDLPGVKHASPASDDVQ